MSSLFKGYGRECGLVSKDNFYEIQNVLSRIGILNERNTSITQTAHIFQKKGKYAIFHFKELFLFDGKKADFSEKDEERRNIIYEFLVVNGLINGKTDLNLWYSDCKERGKELGISFIEYENYKKLGLRTIKKYTFGNNRKI